MSHLLHCPEPRKTRLRRHSFYEAEEQNQATTIACVKRTPFNFQKGNRSSCALLTWSVTISSLCFTYKHKQYKAPTVCKIAARRGKMFPPHAACEDVTPYFSVPLKPFPGIQTTTVCRILSLTVLLL